MEATQTAQPQVTAGETPAKQSLPWRIKLGWGLGSLPLTVLNMAISVLLLRFMTDSLGVAASVAATIFAVAKVWDAFSDPLMGILSDRIRTPWGQRLPWLLGGGLLSALVIIYLFAAPSLSMTALIIYLLAGKLLYATTYTMYMVPYMTMPASLTANYNERTELMSYRVIFSSVGTMIGLSLAPALLAYWGADKAGHMKISLFLGLVAGVTVLASVWCLRIAPERKVVRQTNYPPFFEQLKSALANKPFMWLMSAKLSYFFVLTLTLSTFAFFTKHVLQVSDAMIGFYMGIQSVALICSQPVWLFVAKRWGKQHGFMLACLLFGLTHLSWLLAGPGEAAWSIAVRAVVIGIAGGGTFLLSQSMLPDTLEYDALKNGTDRAGMFTGLYILTEKLSGALGVAFVGMFLGIMGYLESTDGVAVAQPESAKTALYFCIAILPALIQLLSIFFMSRYRLTADDLAALRDKTTIMEKE